MIDLVLFRSGHYRLAVEAREVGGSRRAGARSSAPTCPAIESLFGLPEPGMRAQPMILMLRAPGCEFLADGPLELCNLADQVIHPPPAILATTSQLRGLRALAFDDAGLVLIFSAAA